MSAAPLTDAQIAEGLALDVRAMKGPWLVDIGSAPPDFDDEVLVICAKGADPGYPNEDYPVLSSMFGRSPWGIANAEFAAAMRTLGPAALREVQRLRAALAISPEDCGRIMHESWTQTKRAHGFHGPRETCYYCAPTPGACQWGHPDLIPWEQLPEKQQDINRHAFDEVLAEIRRRALLPDAAQEGRDG